MALRTPPGGSVYTQTNGFGRSDRQSSVYSENPGWAGSQGRGDMNNGDLRPKPRYPHVKDLQHKADAAQEFVGIHTPIRTLLNHAEKSAKQAFTDIEFKRPDRAYIEYLVSSNILLYLIPKHKDYTLVNTDRGGWQRAYKTLCRNNNSQHETFKNIYNMIVEDNIESGIRPSNSAPSGTYPQITNDRSRHTAGSNPRPLSMMAKPTSTTRDTDELFIIAGSDIGSYRDERRLSNQEHISPQQKSIIRKDKPIVRPKPEGLQSRGRVNNGASHFTSSDLLAERFSQLRAQPRTLQIRTESEPRNPPSGTFVEMPCPTDYTPPSPDNPPSLYYSRPNSECLSPTGEHSGSRTLPPRSPNPPHPPKIPLDAGLESSLPRTPSPAYNPSRNYQTLSSTPPPPPRTSSSLRSSKVVTGASRNGEGSNSIHQSSRPNDTGNGVRLTKPGSSDLAHAMTITADELYDHLRAYNVLVIDIRSREEFDQGHIFAKSIMCIEPLGLKSGISAEELEDRLVVSPGAEQALFEQRNEFDLVVYYDQKTRSTSFLTGAPSGNDAFALRALHDTIYEFNYYKPLRRPPVMLIGGIEAWEDLVGRNGLATSSTAALVGSTRPRTLARKPGRPLSRVLMASSNSYLEVRKRRLREYKPLNADEERTWLETARNEEVQTGDYQYAQSDGETDSNHSFADEPASPYIQSYEEFLRKFPEPSSIGKQSMMVALPPPPPPVRPAPSMPTVPSRPPPAVPRPSYGGVSERESSGLSPTSRQPTSAQPPLYTSKSISHYLKLPRTGLINFSVTCYMNATIQCLLATIPLSQFFLDNRWRDFTQKNWKGSNGIMPEIYANLIRSLWRGEVQAIRPTSLRKFCARLNREWGVDRQQDAKEFFDFLLDCLHEDLNLNWERSPLRPLSTEQEQNRECTPMQIVSKVEWERYSHRESSFISSLFAGQHASRLRCTTCQHTSTTYEAFYSISVEIPRSGRGDIYECLRSYCQEEMLSKDEMWKCSYCKCEREATKQITITRAPQVLVVHFKRFSASKTESARKVHTPIHFPLHGLNIEPYMVPPSPDPEFRDNDPAITPPFLYDAYAVMRHLGASGNGGHYISLVRDAARNCWRKFDDERAADFDPRNLKPEQRLQNEQAYLVFYGRSAAR